MGFVANFILFLTEKEIWRSLKFSRSYSKLNFARFLRAQCTMPILQILFYVRQVKRKL